MYAAAAGSSHLAYGKTDGWLFNIIWTSTSYRQQLFLGWDIFANRSYTNGVWSEWKKVTFAQ